MSESEGEGDCLVVEEGDLRGKHAVRGRKRRESKLSGGLKVIKGEKQEERHKQGYTLGIKKNISEKIRRWK